MKQSMYIIGSIEIIFGALILSVISIVKNALPILGRIAYQAGTKGSYYSGDFIASFPLATVIAVMLVAMGIMQIFYPMLKHLRK
ncbi:hypothetical protein JR334_07075 [Clostridia bacterium]|nr:hypothetical protein JR334_07075 [Clostridia bacterium]